MPPSAFLDKLAQLRSNNCENLPTPELAVLNRTVARLRREGLQSKCLQTGETAPDFSLQSHSGGDISLYALLKNGPVVLSFFRGFWCPYCKTEIEAYEDVQGELERMGCTYLAITPQKPVDAATLPSNYDVVYDRDNLIAGRFGIVYELDHAERDLFQSWGLLLDKVNESDKWELPVPATFILAQDRTIGFEYVDVDFRARCCPDQLIKELKSFTA
ncbi:MAG: AhpC/TSA family protein [Pseudomonadales bacterium]|nr:AhpC/TSA family protein [Pseudomonadales bacterium]